MQELKTQKDGGICSFGLSEPTPQSEAIKEYALRQMPVFPHSEDGAADDRDR